MKAVNHQADICVVGGGLAGLCAAVAAARGGARTVLVHDRPVLGGNASSEIRMWVCGAHGDNRRECGILEELELENMYRNPGQNYSVWDSVLYGKARFQENLTLLLNCSVHELAKKGARIASVTGWQLTSETRHTVTAALFADCSGDSVLAPLSGAACRLGREAAGEFGESIAPARADRRTMGMSCLIQARQADRPRPFIPPDWAYRYPDEAAFAHRGHDLKNWATNFWWLELGGEEDSIHDTEAIRDELLKTAFGVWDHIKNHGDHGADNWELDWVGFLPGKRESRRCEGDHILTENDVAAGGRFADTVAYGGWTMDDHHPGGFRHPGPPNAFHPAPSPFGIPYRCLYSRNVENLFFAGRNISTTHAAMSATRVMATCALLGQAVGTAAALAAREGLSPRGLYPAHIPRLQQALMEDDCWLPGRQRAVPDLSARARLSASRGDPEPLRNGHDRPLKAAENAWSGLPGAWVRYDFDRPRPVRKLRFVFDSDLNRKRRNMRAHYPLSGPDRGVPAAMTRAFDVEALDGEGRWHPVAAVGENYQRLVRLDIDVVTAALRFIPRRTWGAPEARLFAWDAR